MNHDHYYKMLLIRRFEEMVLDLFSEGKLSGTTHCYIGQEANAVACMDHVEPGDIVWSNHRCHGHYLALTGDVDGLLSELAGKSSGICAGRGGSQHLCNGQFFTNGIQGSIMPVAAGMAFANRTKGIGVVFIGDGTLGQGVVYETLNMISLMDIPLLVVVENNGYAQSTPIAANLAGGILERIEAFGIDCDEIDSTDVEDIHFEFGKAFEHVRSGKPFVQVINTYRFCSHSKSDDFRDPKEIKRRRANDPLRDIDSDMDQQIGVILRRARAKL